MSYKIDKSSFTHTYHNPLNIKSQKYTRHVYMLVLNYKINYIVV